MKKTVPLKTVVKTWRHLTYLDEKIDEKNRLTKNKALIDKKKKAKLQMFFISFSRPRVLILDRSALQQSETHQSNL